MPSNDMFDDMKLKLDQIVDYAIIAHDNTADPVLENRAVHLYVCAKSFLDQFRRVHQWLESARLFLRSYDEDFPGVRAYAVEWQEQDHEDEAEELAALLENAALDDEDDDEERDDDVFINDLPRNVENPQDAGEEEEVDPEDDWDFDQIMAFFD